MSALVGFSALGYTVGMLELPEIPYEIARQWEATPAAEFDLDELARKLGRDQSLIVAAATLLSQRGLVEIRDEPFEELRLGSEGEAFRDKPLPERIIIDTLAKHGGHVRVTDMPALSGLSSGQVGQTLRWLNQRGWAKKEGDSLVLLDGGRAAVANAEAREADEALLSRLMPGQSARRDELERAGVPVEAALGLLSPRKNFIVVKQRSTRRARLTEAGRAAVAGGVKLRPRVTQLTPELLAEGGWREVELAPYDVTLAAKTLYPGKEHAFQRTLDRVRRVFLEMGFEEIASPWVESSFWDFDALFQPQDHPARDMQDTFYVARPGRARLPDEALVERVKAAHENGGDTGSSGWQYRWRRELAEKPVLRTHTTATTIRALAQHAKTRGSAAGKYFVIGPVFRREAVDYKHLPVFTQVDGIIVDEHASLATLLGTLKAFYRKMGFADVHINPSFYPYTEPSAEVQVFYEKKNEWVEMGGSGLFRPEVTRPLGIEQRVLAWGLGLERLAMMIHNLKSIGELYFATMPWLREAPLSRA